jgi:hypothetical protein
MPRIPDSPAAPRVSPPDLPEQFGDARPVRGADLVAARLRLEDDADLAYATLEQCTLTADAGTVDLTGSTVLDVEMTDVRLASLRMRDAGVRRLRIAGGRLGTLDLSGARIDELELSGLRIEYLNLASARAVDVEIAECGIRTIDAPLAELTRVRFSSTRCDEVDPRGMKATDVDLRGLDALSYLDANSLRGTTLTSFQVQQLAPVLAAGIGIRVTD